MRASVVAIKVSRAGANRASVLQARISVLNAMNAIAKNF